MGTWTNSDGLFIKYGSDEAKSSVNVIGKGGELMDVQGDEHLTEVLITPLTSLATTEKIVVDNLIIPAGARIQEVTVIAETAATSGGSATLDVGFIRADRSTTYDDDGLIAALALTAIDAAGETSVLRVGSTGAGALIGTTLAYNGLITASYNTAAFTAGAVRVRVAWYIPA